jgi:cell wall-associated NlpC family hydrolase
VIVALAVAGCGGSTHQRARPAAADAAPPAPRPRPQVVEPTAGDVSGAAASNQVATGATRARPKRAAVRTATRTPRLVHVAGSASGAAGAPRRPSAALAHQLAQLPARPTASRALALPNGVALPPIQAPDAVRAIIDAGNSIARAPYLWGGGHGKWQDKGYDCSGSVSFALASAGLLNAPQDSGQLMRWGAPGRGRWITVYSSPGHVFLVVAGIRFDTSGQRVNGSRWQEAMRETSGFVARHAPGL